MMDAILHRHPGCRPSPPNEWRTDILVDGEARMVRLYYEGRIQGGESRPVRVETVSPQPIPPGCYDALFCWLGFTLEIL